MDFAELDALIDQFGPAELVKTLEPFLTESRKARIENVLAGRLDSVRVAVEQPEDPHNAAAIVRSAEALGAMHVHMIDPFGGAPEQEVEASGSGREQIRDTPSPVRSRTRVLRRQALHSPGTTQGAYCWVHTYHHASLEELLAATRAQGLVIAGAMMDGGCTVHELPADKPILLLFGNEGTGLSSEARAACSYRFRIPMVGMSESLNLSVSAALALYSVTRARREWLGTTGDLRADRLLYERARYYARSVDRRLLDGIIEQRAQ